MKKSDNNILLNIDVIVQDPQWNVDIPNVKNICRDAACLAFSSGNLKLTLVEAAIVLADDRFVASLNLKYRNTKGPTNVLSFAACDLESLAVSVSKDAPIMLGDVIFARETIVKEAVDLAISLEHHLRHLIVHGALHLLGYDHQVDEDADEMERLEIKLLAKMGVPNPYNLDIGMVAVARS